MNILLIGVIINASMTVTNSMPCEEGWLVKDGTCFNYYSLKVPWFSADKTCLDLRKGILATVDSPEINMFVHNTTRGTRGSDVWIGLRIPDISKSSWKWSDGNNTFFYNDWTMTDVNSSCAVMTYANSKGYWYTRPCTDTISYICEREMVADNCSDWLSFEAHCYLIKTKHTETNMAAARKCWLDDAYLVSINSESEAYFIYHKIEKKKKYWIGLSPLKWVNDIPYQWNNWGDIGPNLNVSNGCVYMNKESGKWFYGNCGSSFLPDEHHSYICQKNAVTDSPTIPNVAEGVYISTTTVHSESNTIGLDALSVSTIPSSNENSKQLMLTVVVPVVCGGLVAIIVIIVVVILILRKRRSNESGKRNPPQMNTTHVTIDKTVGGEHQDIGEHQDQEKYIYDEAEVVQADNGTVIVDNDKIQNPTVQDNMVSQQHTKNNRKQEISKGQNHIIIGSDVYAIVNKSSVKPDKQQKPKQKKKKPPTPPKLEDKSEEINSSGLNHIVVGTDVYAVVDKDKAKHNKQQTSQQKTKKPQTPPKIEDKTETINTKGHIVAGTDVYAVVDKGKVKPTTQQTPQQMKKKPPAPPKLVDKADVMHEGSVNYESDMNALPPTPTKHKTEGKKKPENTGVVYADLDLTESGSGYCQDGIYDEQSGVVYADVRG